VDQVRGPNRTYVELFPALFLVMTGFQCAPTGSSHSLDWLSTERGVLRERSDTRRSVVATVVNGYIAKCEAGAQPSPSLDWGLFHFLVLELSVQVESHL
jgi:hypothetical protein